MFEQPDQGRFVPRAVSFSDTKRSVAQIDKNFLKAGETIGNAPDGVCRARLPEKRFSLFRIML
jgi:hypothetical protein